MNAQIPPAPSAPSALSAILPRGAPALSVTVVVLLLFTAATAASVIFSETAPWAILMPLVGLVGLIAVWLIMKAVAGSVPAIIAYLTILLFITDAQFRARGAGDISTDWQSLLKFLLWTGAGVIGFAHLPPISKILSRPGAGLWFLYISIAIISSAYAPTPVYSFGCAFSLLCFFAFAYALTRKLTEGQLLWTMVLTFSVFLIAGWVVFYKDPALGTSQFWTYGGIEFRMCGIAGQANNLGSVCAKFIGAVFLLWINRRCGLIPALAFGALGVATLIASDARTGMIAVVVAIGAVLASRSLWLIAMSLLATVSAMIASLVFPVGLDVIGKHFSRSGDPTEIYTLTGRLEIWAFVWQKIKESPFLGWGYNASKVLLPQHVGFDYGLMIDTAHNMLLQTLLSVGFIGTMPIIGVLALLGYNMLFRPNRLRDLYFIIVVITGISDTSALGTTPTNLTLMFMIISILPAAPFRRRVTIDTGLAGPEGAFRRRSRSKPPLSGLPA